ncbi:helix-turn-helix transcriptional regulator [Roseovarius indicus]|uniref:helix-turn-helix transcriptional regulator n=1 Tax=Roseovarius indicus TaxID=540747 RepID=UPI0032EF3954
MFADFIIASGKTRKDWADRIGVSKSYLSDLVNGKAVPSLVVATKIELLTGGEVTASSWIKVEPSDDCAADSQGEEA